MRKLLVLLIIGWAGFLVMVLGKPWGLSLGDTADVMASVYSQQPVALPCAVGQTGLVAVGIGRYEGIFPEDGSQVPVVDAAALVIKNDSGVHLERGAVLLETESGQYVFEFYALPPGERVFVVEASRKPYITGAVLSCDGWAAEEEEPDYRNFLEIRESGPGILRVTNTAENLLPQLELIYKTYDEASGVYIGGICYRVQLQPLRPGESHVLTPDRYTSGSSRIVYAKGAK